MREQIDSFDRSTDIPDGAMWDGKYLMLADYHSASGTLNLYRVTSTHDGAVKTVGVTTLSDQACGNRPYALGPWPPRRDMPPCENYCAVIFVI